MSELGLGLAAVGRPAYFISGRELGDDRSPTAMRAVTEELLDVAYGSGIRYFDAARSYGRAEEFLAGWLDRRQLDDVTIGSKWGYRYVGQWQVDADVHEVKDHSLEALDIQLAESRRWLDDRMDLYQIHSATIESQVLDDDAVLRRLSELAAEGMMVGLSVSGPDQATTIRKALSVDVDGDNPFACVQATWNLLEQSAAPALAEAHSAGWGVILKEVMANGRLSVDPPESVERRARSLAVEPASLAVAAALAQEWVSVVLLGATAPHHILSAGAAPALRQDVAWGLAENPVEYWQRRSRLPWG